MASHTIVHFEIPADDPDKLAAFYSQLFGWKIEKFPGEEMEYWSVYTVPVDEKGMPAEPGVNGGMMRRQMPEQAPVNYISVESVEQYVGKAKSLGATVVVDKTEVSGMGWFAVLLDPQRNSFGVWQEAGAMA